MGDSAVELFWLPVGAGTHFQRASLALLAWCIGVATRKPRAQFVHAGLKVRTGGRTSTVELMPVPRQPGVEPLITGAVGVRLAGRLRIFRYQLMCQEADELPDEQWAIGSPLVLSTDEAVAALVVDSGRRVPANTWGRRARGTSEMWTSDSAISWMLVRAGVDVAAIHVPAGCRAPGWRAGIEAARSPG